MSGGTCIGADSLMKLLSNYCRNAGIKTTISVGVVGECGCPDFNLYCAKFASFAALPWLGDSRVFCILDFSVCMKFNTYVSAWSCFKKLP